MEKPLRILLVIVGFLAVSYLVAESKPKKGDIFYLSLVQGNPGIPGDGLVVNLSDGLDPLWLNDFELQTPFSLAGITEGITVSAFPPRDIPITEISGLQINFAVASPPIQRCSFGGGASATLTPIVNGVQGIASVYSQQRLMDLIALVRAESPGCGQVTLDQLFIHSFYVFVSNRLDALAVGIGENVFPASDSLKIIRDIDRQGSILLTYQVLEETANDITLNLTLTNIARTWYLIRREGTLMVSDQDIPFVFLLAPDQPILFMNIRFTRGESLSFTATKAGIENNDQLLALGALSVDMFGRGLFGITLPSSVFEGTQLQLLGAYTLLYLNEILEKLFEKLAIKSFPKFITEVIILTPNLNMNDLTTQLLINELYDGLTDAAKWGGAIAKGIDFITDLYNLPANEELVRDLWKMTDKAPVSGFAGIRTQ